MDPHFVHIPYMTCVDRPEGHVQAIGMNTVAAVAHATKKALCEVNLSVLPFVHVSNATR